MKFVIFQVNADFLINQLTKYFYFKHLTPLLSFKKQKFRSPSQNLLETSTFTTFLQIFTVDELYNISNKNQLPNRSAKYLLFYTKDLTCLLHFQGKLALSIGEVPGNIHFLPLFHWFWEWVRCLILQINTSVLISHQKTYIFTQETLYISFTYLHIGVFRTQWNI